jgi:biopolymer transport protein ExbD
MAQQKSRKAARMERRHKRDKKGVALNLTSLMDIFTILVFFLLVNSAAQTPPSNKDLTLPQSTAKKEMKENVLIMVTGESILVQGLKVADSNEAKALEEDLIPELLDELRRQSARIKESTNDPVKATEITIMGDKEIPYKLLRKLMFTCTESNFTRISLAVMKKAGGGGDE